MKYFYTQKILKFTKAIKKVYFALFHIQKYQRLIQISHQQIADKLGLCRRTVIRCVKFLEENNCIIVVRGDRKYNFWLNKIGKISRSLMVNIYMVGLQNKDKEIFYRDLASDKENFNAKEKYLYDVITKRSFLVFKRKAYSKKPKEYFDQLAETIKIKLKQKEEIVELQKNEVIYEKTEKKVKEIEEFDFETKSLSESFGFLSSLLKKV
jgi:biotin operon repressor